MEKLKKEKGAILIYVLISMLILIILLMGVYNLITNKHITQLEIAQQIKSTYEEDVNNIDAIYNDLTGATDNELLQKIDNLIDAKLANYDTSAQVSNKISTNSVGFPDYANRTALTLGKEYTADENMYVIIDFTGKNGTYSSLKATIDGTTYYWYQGVTNVDHNHSTADIIPIKQGSVYKIECPGACNAYKVSMIY